MLSTGIPNVMIGYFSLQSDKFRGKIMEVISDLASNLNN